MKEWQQHIPVPDWIAFLDGACPLNVRRRVAVHIIECPGCRLFHGEMQAVRDALRRQGAALASRQDIAGTDAALSRVLLALRQGHPSARSTVDQRLASVVRVITPLLGAQGVTRMIAAARKSLNLHGRGAVSEERWPEFLRRIASVTALMSGDTAAELAWFAGME